MNNVNIPCPCKDCKDRHVACHCDCKPYKDYVIELKEAQKRGCNRNREVSNYKRNEKTKYLREVRRTRRKDR